MTLSAMGPLRRHHWLSLVGAAILSVGFVWWFLFYAQWTGPLRLLDLKVPCLVYTSGECSFFRSQMENFHASGPMYQPIVWWIGIAAFASGQLLSRGAKNGDHQ